MPEVITNGYSAFVLATSKQFTIVAAIFGAWLLAVASTLFAAGGEPSQIDVNVDCKCADAVGQKFCAVFKQKVRESKSYRLVETATAFGMGVHFSSIDMWQGINSQLLGRMSAVSVAFTIYSDKLPGDVYEDSSVFRVGIDAVPEMATRILGGLDQLATVTANSFNELRPRASPTAAH